jgi:uncharacterized protein YndB with AHSA1/START domain
MLLHSVGKCATLELRCPSWCQEAEMLVRQVVIPASPEQLWDALTEPESVSAWFGSRVEWELRPGGRARFFEDDGTVRRGVVDDVRPARYLRFRWWPEHQGPDANDDATTQVSYDLEPEEDGTLLTVTERPVPARSGTANGGEDSPDVPSASAARTGWTGPGAGTAAIAGTAVAAGTAGGAGMAGGATTAVGSWTDWDSRLFGCWARAAVLTSVGGAIR